MDADSLERVWFITFLVLPCLPTMTLESPGSTVHPLYQSTMEKDDSDHNDDEDSFNEDDDLNPTNVSASYDDDSMASSATEYLEFSEVSFDPYPSDQASTERHSAKLSFCGVHMPGGDFSPAGLLDWTCAGRWFSQQAPEAETCSKEDKKSPRLNSDNKTMIDGSLAFSEDSVSSSSVVLEGVETTLPGEGENAAPFSCNVGQTIVVHLMKCTGVGTGITTTNTHAEWTSSNASRRNQILRDIAICMNVPFDEFNSEPPKPEPTTEDFESVETLPQKRHTSEDATRSRHGIPGRLKLPRQVSRLRRLRANGKSRNRPTPVSP